jgi:hypothetical protein
MSNWSKWAFDNASLFSLIGTWNVRHERTALCQRSLYQLCSQLISLPGWRLSVIFGVVNHLFVSFHLGVCVTLVIHLNYIELLPTWNARPEKSKLQRIARSRCKSWCLWLQLDQRNIKIAFKIFEIKFLSVLKIFCFFMPKSVSFHFTREFFILNFSDIYLIIWSIWFAKYCCMIWRLRKRGKKFIFPLNS